MPNTCFKRFYLRELERRAWVRWAYYVKIYACSGAFIQKVAGSGVLMAEGGIGHRDGKRSSPEWPEGKNPGLGLLKAWQDSCDGWSTRSRWSWRSSNGIFQRYWSCRRRRYLFHGSNGRSNLSLSKVLAGGCHRTEWWRSWRFGGMSKGSWRPLLWHKTTT